MYQEQVLLPEGLLLEVLFNSTSNYRLTLRKGNRNLVEYSNKTARDFKSVEQLRYDFEKDVESALRKGR